MKKLMTIAATGLLLAGVGAVQVNAAETTDASHPRIERKSGVSRKNFGKMRAVQRNNSDAKTDSVKRSPHRRTSGRHCWATCNHPRHNQAVKDAKANGSGNADGAAVSGAKNGKNFGRIKKGAQRAATRGVQK